MDLASLLRETGPVGEAREGLRDDDAVSERLVREVPGHPPPDWFSSLLGNFALRGFLGYALPIPVFFELSVFSEKARAFRARFETIGCDLRPILHKPKYTPLKPLAVEQLFGVKLDTLLTEST
jgi:hypothetical protein